MRLIGFLQVLFFCSPWPKVALHVRSLSGLGWRRVRFDESELKA